MTEAYPDIIESLLDAIDVNKIDSMIVDSEIVGFDPESGRILPFQTLMTRNKKNVTTGNIEVQVCIYIFDILYLNGESLLQKNLTERRELLFGNVKEIEGKVKYVKHENTQEVEQIQELLNESVKIGCEGLMLKTLGDNSSYEPCMRTFKWLKMKRDYLESSLGDSLDLVPIGNFFYKLKMLGAKFGEGRRTGFYGGFLLAAYNDDTDLFETTCVVGSGFTDESLKKVYDILKENTIEGPLDEYQVAGIQNSKNVRLLLVNQK
jgi:DNA ligase-1